MYYILLIGRSDAIVCGLCFDNYCKSIGWRKVCGVAKPVQDDQAIQQKLAA